MNKSRLDHWTCQTEGLPALSREALNALQLSRLNETLARLQARWGSRCPYPERLDSALFPLDSLVDYEAFLEQSLTLRARVLRPHLEEALISAAQSCFPGLPVNALCLPYDPVEGPLYPGKRYFKG